MADTQDIVERNALYTAVWKTIKAIAVDAAPGSITPETFARVAVDVVMIELLKAGVINPAYRQ
ncbi:MAG TPA: hypothetical protein VH024_17345 [Candidatus Angelobacter sp.]|jgi:hypothetical protein|nr:hypothetical protein [Candidatus Angelobacter sp.]